MKCDKLKSYYYYEDRVFTPATHTYRVYHADKVDAAIAELKQKFHDVDNQWNEQCKEIAELKAIRKVHIEAIESMGAGLQQDEEEIRHQKYRRCLAMASTCRLRARWFGDNAFYKNEQWALQWHNRWLELAEKFKPNKEAK